jgi:lipopolysaccharide export system permease protein
MGGLLYEKLVFREIVQPFLMTLVGLSILFLMARLLGYIEPLLNAGISLGEFGKLILLMLPVFLMVILPIATLLGALLAAMRLARDNEMVALFACGVSTARLARPFVIFAIACWIVSLATATLVVPAAKTASRSFLKEITEAVFLRGLPEKVFFSPHKGLTFYIDRTDDSGRELHGVYIRDTRLKNMPYQILAREGHLAVKPDRSSIVLKLSHGTMTSQGSDKGVVDLLDFNSYALSLSTPVAKHGKKRGEMGLSELYRRGHETEDDPEYALSCLVELHKRLAIPTGTLIFGVIALPLGVFLGRTGLAGGIAAGLAGFIIYYMTIIFASNMAEQGLIPPSISLWLPNAGFGFLTFRLLRRLAEKGPVAG